MALRSRAGFLGIVRLANGLSKATVQLTAIQDDLLRMHCLDRIERNDEVARILDVDHKLGPAGWRNLADSAELLATVGSKRLVSYLDMFWHDSLLRIFILRFKKVSAKIRPSSPTFSPQHSSGDRRANLACA
jgi:hypothetical protein